MSSVISQYRVAEEVAEEEGATYEGGLIRVADDRDFNVGAALKKGKGKIEVDSDDALPHLRARRPSHRPRREGHRGPSQEGRRGARPGRRRTAAPTATARARSPRVMPTIETNYYAAWIGGQSAKGTPNTTPSRLLQQQAARSRSSATTAPRRSRTRPSTGGYRGLGQQQPGPRRPGAPRHADRVGLRAVAHARCRGHSAISAVSARRMIPAMARHRFTPTSTIGYYPRSSSVSAR